MPNQAPNILNTDLPCPKCGAKISSGIGFRVGKVAGLSYEIGDRITWGDSGNRPAVRPQDGSLKTIGYFECENLDCETWQDCFPEVQEVLIVIENDVIEDVKPTIHKPGVVSFDIIEPGDVT